MNRKIGLLAGLCLLGMFPTGLAESTKSIKGDGKDFNRMPVNWKASAEDKAKARSAWEIISQWNKDGEKSPCRLNVVYVTLKDRPALKDYKGRLDRIVKNIQAYYADQMKENGFPPLTFSLDLDKEGKVMVHDAYLDVPMDSLDVHSSGRASWEVARAALIKAGINPEKEYSLIVVQMPDKKGPYYGGGSFESGRCWVCDAEHLDPLNFNSNERGDYLFGTVAKDNTVYIGGTAHELGHCFSLPHTKNLTPDSETGASLMGNGNYSYGKELRGEGKGAFLIQSDALRLASLPLFNGRFKAVAKTPVVQFGEFRATPIKDGLEISGKLKANPPVYGLVAYFDPVGGSDYDASTTTCVPAKDGSFKIPVTRPGYKGGFEMRLVALHANGASSTTRAMLEAKESGIDTSPVIANCLLGELKQAWMKRDWKQAANELEKVKKTYGGDPALKPLFAAWDKAVVPPVDFTSGESPAQVKDSEKMASMVGMKAQEARSGWWVPLRNTLPPNPNDPRPMLRSGISENFIYTHAPGKFSYDLGGKWKTFSAVVGIPVSAYGKIVFRVLGDGKPLFESDVLKEGASKKVSVDVSGVRSLNIEVNTAPGSSDNGGCWGIIADPELSR